MPIEITIDLYREAIELIDQARALHERILEDDPTIRDHDVRTLRDAQIDWLNAVQCPELSGEES